MENTSSGGFTGFLRRRVQGLWQRVWPLTIGRAAVLVGILFVILFVAVEIGSTQSFSVEVVVVPEEDFVGLNPTTESLDFGDMSNGTAQARYLNLSNEGSLPTRVSVIVTGDVRDFVKVSDAFFTMDPGDSTRVEFTLVVPATVPEKKYTGRVLVLRTPWSPWP